MGAIVSMATGVAVSLHFSTAEEPEIGTAMERCVTQHLKAVPGYQRPGAAVLFTELCHEILRS